jgi:hypothetical protein
VDGCGAGGGAGAQELGVRGVGSIARGEWWEQGLRGWRGTHQTQQEGAAAAGQALQGRQVPSANGGEGGSKKCGRGSSGQGKNNEEVRRSVGVNAWMRGGGWGRIRCGLVLDGGAAVALVV